MSIVQEIPDARSRITLDPVVKDITGMPAARIYAVANPATAILQIILPKMQQNGSRLLEVKKS